MVEIETIVEDESDICNVLVNNVQSRLEDLLDRQERTGKETAMAFEITKGGIVNTSSIDTGGDKSIDMMTQSTLIAEFYPYEKTDRLGVIHTHPVEEGYLNLMLSPGDMGTHLQMADQTPDYVASLVLTKDEGDYVIFGIDSTGVESGFGNSQDRVAALKRSLDSGSGFTQYEVLKEMANELDSVGDWCYKRW